MTNARKKAVNVSLGADLVVQARAYGIGLSQTLEEALGERVRQSRLEQWQRENRQAFAAQNAELADHGLWSDGARLW